MELWRISIFSDLSGVGGLLANGRWHTQGHAVVYLSDHPSTALLERLVQVRPDELPSSYQLLRVSIPDDVPTAHVDLAVLAENWRDRTDATRCIGDEWLDGGTGALLHVPSALAPYAANYLLNPAHALASKVSIIETIIAYFDRRFWKAP